MQSFQKPVLWIMEEAKKAPKLFVLIFVGFPLLALLGSVLMWGLAAPP